MLRSFFCRFALLVLLGGAAPLSFAGGDKAGEEQPPPPASLVIPPAPPLSVEESLKSFKLQPGFHLEVVAAEPLVRDPIALTFDPDGRMYVVEMRGFMPDAEGRGENLPVGEIVILEDTDGDGRADKRTVFADKLVMPRAVNLSNGGVIIAEPPKLLFCKDRDGDGVADTRGTLPFSFGSQSNPEHTANGLLNGLDNWIYNANSELRFRWRNRRFTGETTTTRGQWGLTQDDWGRLYFNSNSNLLFADALPAHYLFRNAYFAAAKPEQAALGVGAEIVKDQHVFSSRINTGVNRGYQKGTLRADFHLDRVTATCGAGVYRGDQFPPEYRGNVFIPEPSANLIKRVVVSENGLQLSGKSAYENAEFLTSTEERFRPVNTYTAPDGTLYIVDFHRGILQHRIYLTTYLKKQALQRELDKFTGMGRIYRVVADNKKPGERPALGKATSEGLVKTLTHPNGWWRDTAQRLLVERGDEAVVPALRKLASAPEPDGSFGRLHALWTLEGLNAVDTPTVVAALEDPRPKLRMHALRVAEALLKAPPQEPGEAPKPFTPPPDLLNAIKDFSVKNTDLAVRVQIALTISDVQSPSAEEILDGFLRDNVDEPAIRVAALSGLGGRELEYLEKLLRMPQWSSASAARSALLSALSACVMKRRIGERVEKLIEVAAAQPGAWSQAALLSGLVKGGPKNGRRVKISQESKALLKLAESPDAVVKAEAKKLDALLKWAGRPGLEPEPPALAGAHLESFERGRVAYKLCAECHHPQGWGIDGKAPPLVDSDWALGTEQRTVRMILHGMSGPKRIGDVTFNANGNLEMPAMGGALTDQQIADVLTYIRREWENFAPQVGVEAVAQIRAKEKGREAPWTEKELEPFGPRAPAPPKDSKPK